MLVWLAAGAPVAQAAWPVDMPFPPVHTTNVTVAPDHRVGLLDGCSSNQPQPFADLSATGDALWTVPADADLATLDSCIGPFYDHLGNAYFSGTDSTGQHHLVSYDATGNRRWSAPLLYGLNINTPRTFADLEFPNPPYPGPGDIAEGADGNIYLLDARDTGIGLQIHLRSLNPQTGASGLDINLQTGTGGQVYPGALLQTTSTGILVGTNQGARFYSYHGTLQWDQGYWGGTTGIPGLGMRDRTPDGGFLAAGDYAATGQCSSPSSDPARVVNRVDKITASGLAWSVTIPTSGTTGTCEDLIGPVRVHATPDGGAILVKSPRYGAGRQTLTGIGPDGRVRWALPTDTDGIEDVRVGADATAVVIEHGTRPCGPAGDVPPHYTCGTLLLQFISATTGSATRPDIVIGTPDPSALASRGGVVPIIPALVDAQADTDRLVMSYTMTTDPASPPGAEFLRVDAIPVPGLGPDLAFNSDARVPSGGGGGGGGGPTGTGGAGGGPGGNPGPGGGPGSGRFVYRAIGDSIPAGFGLHGGVAANVSCASRLPVPDCDSPQQAYPAVIAGVQQPVGPAALGLVPLSGPIDFANGAIAGSQTSYWLAPHRLDSLFAAHPQLVTVTLGADDLLGNPTEGLVCLTDVVCVERTVAQTKRKLHELLGELVSGTHARILITGYHNVLFDRVGAVAWLNSAIAGAATGFGARVSFVPIESFAHHQCQDFLSSWLIVGDVLCLHLNPAGHTVYARDILQAWRSKTSPNGQPPPQAVSGADDISALGERGLIVGGTIGFKVVSVGYQRVTGIATWITTHPGVLFARLARQRHVRTLSRVRRVILHPRYSDGVATVVVHLTRAERRGHGSVAIEVLRCASRHSGCGALLRAHAHTIGRF